jgi:misacylated tRNA(Ala) deacylase
MTEELFATDSSLREFTAVVTEADAAEGAIALDRTAFFPGGGGQPHDLGEIAHGAQQLPVSRVQRKGDVIWHWVAGPAASLPPAGSEVRGRLDWARRHALMRTHTALHILCGVVWRDYKAQVTGGNMEPLRGRLDFEFETLEHDLVAEIEQKINIEVTAAREVRVRIMPREEAMQVPDLIRTKVNLLPPALTRIRTVEIVGLDLQADGGTHVANTREVGPIRVLGYKSKGRINKRIEVGVEP